MKPTVKIEDIDRQLAEWKKKLKAASNNVMDLTRGSTYQRLLGHGVSLDDLGETTRAAVAPALRAMEALWQSFALLMAPIERAEELRKKLPRLFGTQEQLQEIEKLLVEPSIQLPSLVIPLAQRSLLTTAEVKRQVTPAQMLEAMTSAFERACQVITSLEQAWAEVDTQLLSIDQALSRLDLGADSEDPLRLRWRALMGDCRHDPLGVAQALQSELLPTLQRRLEAQAQQRTTLEKLALGPSRLQQLRELHSRCESAWAECTRTLDGPCGPGRKDPQLIDRLETRWDKMQAHLADGSWTPTQVSIGWESWLQQADDFANSERMALQAFETLHAEREELKGRFRAYRSRATRCALSEEAELARLDQNVERLLAPPTHLALAREALERYRSALERLSTA